MAERTYRIICSDGSDRDEEGKWKRTVLSTGLSYEEARIEENRLQTEETRANPTRSSWTGNIFYLELETPDHYTVLRNDAVVESGLLHKDAVTLINRLWEEVRRPGLFSNSTSLDVFYMRLED